jgi:hypothetical protein
MFEFKVGDLVSKYDWITLTNNSLTKRIQGIILSISFDPSNTRSFKVLWFKENKISFEWAFFLKKINVEEENIL